VTEPADQGGPGIVVRRRRGYTVVYNDLLPAEGEISARAWGIFVYLLGRPDGWTCRASHLATVFKEGRDAVYTALRELAAVDLMEREPYYEGNLRRTRYALNADGKGGTDAKRDDAGGQQTPRSSPDTDSQEPENPTLPGTDSQEPGSQEPDAPDAENPGGVSTEVATTEVATTEEQPPLRAAAPAAAKSPEQEADAVAEWWWEALDPKPVTAGRGTGFPGFRNLVRGARRAGFTQREIAKALQAMKAHDGTVWPSTAQLDRACRAVREGREPGPVKRQVDNRFVDTGDEVLHERQDAMFEGTG
jgi:hypothetical protein